MTPAHFIPSQPDLDLLRLQSSVMAELRDMEEPECEFGHHPSYTNEGAICLQKVTHLARQRCTGKSMLICENAAKYQLRHITNPDGKDICSECKLPCGVCWTVTPI